MAVTTGRIVIVGPGAMGCLFAGMLAGAGHEVWLLDKRPERSKSIADTGVTIEAQGQSSSFSVKATTDPREAGPASLLIFCVKAYSTIKAAAMAAPTLAPDGNALSLQNGLGNVEALIEVFGPERVLGGTTAQGATALGPGRVRHAGVGETVIGQPGGGDDRARAVADLFNQSGLATTVTDDLESLIWSKLVINAAINPLTAALRVKNGALPQIPSAVEIMRQAVSEVSRVCEKKGIGLLFDDPLDKALSVAEATGANLSSMLQDALKNRRTEIGQINGAVWREAEKIGVPAPVNRILALLVEAMENAYEQRER